MLNQVILRSDYDIYFFEHFALVALHYDLEGDEDSSTQPCTAAHRQRSSSTAQGTGHDQIYKTSSWSGLRHPKADSVLVSARSDCLWAPLQNISWLACETSETSQYHNRFPYCPDMSRLGRGWSCCHNGICSEKMFHPQLCKCHTSGIRSCNV